MADHPTSYTIPPGLPFVDALALGLLERHADALASASSDAVSEVSDKSDAVGLLLRRQLADLVSTSEQAVALKKLFRPN